MNAAVERDLESLAESLRASTVAVRVGRVGGGSGVIWSPDGAIVTNAHVAAASALEVVLSDGRRFPARIERRDVRRDLALLRIDADGLPAVEVRDPVDVRPGEILVAVGHPLGVPNALTMGIAHAPLARGGRRFVQADLRLAPGNSGGPLADASGRVVGINSMVAAGLALAVPSDDVRSFVGAPAAGPRLGVTLAPARLRDGTAVLVVIGVEPGSRAERAGLQIGDALPVIDPARLAQQAVVNVVRAGNTLAVTVPPADRSARAA